MNTSVLPVTINYSPQHQEGKENVLGEAFMKEAILTTEIHYH